MRLASLRAAFSVASSRTDGPPRIGEGCLDGVDAVEQYGPLGAVLPRIPRHSMPGR